LDIDLGSAYARSLGFEEEPPEEDATPLSPKTKKKKKKTKKKKTPETKKEHHKNVEVAIPSTHLSPTKVEEEDDHTDPSLSKESWWADLKTEFLDVDKKKEAQEEDAGDWWGALKQELQDIEK